MNLTLCNYDQAFALKSLGFPQEDETYDYGTPFYCKVNSKMYGIDEHGRLYPIVKAKKTKVYKIGHEIAYKVENTAIAPTLALAKKWLLTEKGIFIHIGMSCDFKFQVYLQNALEKDHNIISEAFQYDTEDEALSKGIDETIKKLKEYAEKICQENTTRKS